MNKIFLHAWIGSTQIFRKASFSENRLYFAGGLCQIDGYLLLCICEHLVFEDNLWTELLPEHMHLAEKINVWLEGLTHLWLRIFVNGVLGKGPVCFNSSYCYLKTNGNWVLSIWKMQAFCDEYIWD